MLPTYAKFTSEGYRLIFYNAYCSYFPRVLCEEEAFGSHTNELDSIGVFTSAGLPCYHQLYLCRNIPLQSKARFDKAPAVFNVQNLEHPHRL